MPGNKGDASRSPNSRVKVDQLLTALNAARFLASRRTAHNSQARKSSLYEVIKASATGDEVPNSGSRLEEGALERTGKPLRANSDWWKDLNDSDYRLNVGLTTGKLSRIKDGSYVMGDDSAETNDRKSRGSSGYDVTAEKSPAGEHQGSPYYLSSQGNSPSTRWNRPRSALLPDNRQADKFHVKKSSVWKPPLRARLQNHKFPLVHAQMVRIPRDKPATSYKSQAKLSSTWRPFFSAWWPGHKKSQLSQVRTVSSRQQGSTSRTWHGRLSSTHSSPFNVWLLDRKLPAGLPGRRMTKSYVKLLWAWRPSLRAWWAAFSTDKSHNAPRAPARDPVTSRGLSDVIASGDVTRLVDNSVMVASKGPVQPIVLVKSARRGMHAKYRVHKQPSPMQNIDNSPPRDEDENNHRRVLDLFRRRRRRRSVVDKKTAAAAGLAEQSRAKTLKTSSRQSRDDDDDDDDKYEEDEEMDRRDTDDDDDDDDDEVSDEELQDLDAEMANAEEDADEEEEEDEDRRSNRNKKDEQTASKKRASENEVTVSKDLMKQMEDNIYKRVVELVKGGSAGGSTTPATGSTTPSGSTTPGAGGSTTTSAGEEEEEEEELLEEEINI